MARRYPQVKNGDRVLPQMQGYRMACCDCGLVHLIDFEVVRVTQQRGDDVWAAKPRNADALRVVLVPRRDNRKTAAHRRERAKKNP